MEKQKKKPTFFQSLLPLAAIALFLGVGYGIYHLNAEILLIAAAAVAGLVALRLGYSYKEMENGMLESMMKGMPAMLIVIVVGTIIGSWIASGTIPMLIYYGLKIISPQYFLITASLVCSIISLVTGTSYGTVGTLGVAFMGIAHGMGIPPGQAAGAIVAGAYFGDKLSPFSDTTNLAPIAAGSNLFDHIRHMLWTTAPAWLLGLAVYFFLGLHAGPAGNVSLARTQEIMQGIRTNFTFSGWLLLPAAITLVSAILKKPVIPNMLLSSLVAVVLALIFQKTDLATGVSSMVTGFVSHTGVPMVDRLLSRGGMVAMMHVTLIAFCAFAFGGIIQKAGMLDVILERLLRVADTVGKLIASTVFATIATAVMTGSSFLSILIPGELFSPAYKKFNLAAKNLSRTTEDSGTVVVPLIPWSIAGVFMSGTLGVEVADYAPWAVMCYTGFIFALIYGFTGFAIAPKVREDETVQGS